MMKYILITIGTVAAAFALIFILNGVGFINYQFWAPKMENVRREVFTNTRSYNEGKVQDLVKYRLEYLREEDPAAKEAIRSTILMMFGDYPRDRLPKQLAYFLQDL